MTTYPDHDDMTAAKRGSDHDRAEAWRIVAHDLRAERDAATALMEDLRRQMRKARVHAADCERLVTAAEHDLDAERLRADGLAAELAASKRLYADKCDQHMAEHTARLRAEAALVAARRAGLPGSGCGLTGGES